MSRALRSGSSWVTCSRYLPMRIKRLVRTLRSREKPGFCGGISHEGTVKLTDLWTYSAPWILHKLLILRLSSDRFRLQTQRILLNLTVPCPGPEGSFLL